MARRFAIVVVALALAAPAWAQYHYPGPKQVRIAVSGFSENINSPSAPTPTTRGFNITEGWSTLGPVLVTLVGGGSQGPFTKPAWCDYESTMVSFARSIRGAEVGVRFTLNGDLLILKGTPDDASGICMDFEHGQYKGRSFGTVLGGTGRFKGVTGTYETTFQGSFFAQGFADAITMIEQSFDITVER